MNNNINNTFSATTVPQLDPGFTFDTAFDLGIADGGLTVNEAVGGTDQGDIYAFSISQAGQYNLSLSGLTADSDLWLMNDLGQAVDFSDLVGNQNELISTQLTPGNYYAIVNSYDGQATNYTLDISNDALTTPPITEVPDPNLSPTGNVITPDTDPGFTFDTAFDLGTIQGDLTINEATGGTDEGDIYSFGISEAGLYNISLNGLTADSDLWLFDGQGEVINFSEMPGTENELISAQLTPGSYHAIAVSYDGIATNYTLSISNYSGGFGETGTEGLIGEDLDPIEPGFEAIGQDPYNPYVDPGFTLDFGGWSSFDYPIGGVGGFDPYIGGGSGFDFEQTMLESEIRHDQFIETIWAE